MDVTASPKPNGIMVSWTSPDYPTKDKIQCYKLVMTNHYDETQTRDIKPNNKGDGSILMSNVSSNTEYSFTIATAAKGPSSLRDKCQLPCEAESMPSKVVKCVTKGIILLQTVWLETIKILYVELKLERITMIRNMFIWASLKDIDV